jgi:hypothetical protein
MKLKEYMKLRSGKEEDTLYDDVVWLFKYGIRRKIKNARYWFLYRLHPRHQYHILRLGKPGYSDPRHQLIWAVMRMVERYVGELKAYESTKDKTVREIAEAQIEAYKEYEWYDPDAEHFWINHYTSLIDLWEWWESVRDHDDLDIDFEYNGHDKNSPVWYEEVDRRLKQAIDLRLGMWT